MENNFAGGLTLASPVAWLLLPRGYPMVISFLAGPGAKDFPVRRSFRHVAQVFLVAVGLGMFAAASAEAAPIVLATVTPSGPLFHYDYEITFDPSDDELALLTVNVLADDATLVNVVAPADYLAVYSSAAGQGFLDFLPLFGFPTSGTLAGFAFDSAHAPDATTFDALTIFGDSLSGPTTGPLGPDTSAVPEPATWTLLTLGLGALARRRTVRKLSRPRY